VSWAIQGYWKALPLLTAGHYPMHIAVLWQEWIAPTSIDTLEWKGVGKSSAVLKESLACG